MSLTKTSQEYLRAKNLSLQLAAQLIILHYKKKL